jgi:hypothetical protein
MVARGRLAVIGTKSAWTGYLGAGASPLSRITVGTLQYLGYQVDYSKADAFTRSDLNSTCTCYIRRLRQKERSLLDMNHGEVFPW